MAQFVGWRGIPLGKPVRFENNKLGFERIVAEAERLRKQRNMADIVLGLEPTGPYWKALAWRLKSLGLRGVTVNTHHTKQAKELDLMWPPVNPSARPCIGASVIFVYKLLSSFPGIMAMNFKFSKNMSFTHGLSYGIL